MKHIANTLLLCVSLSATAQNPIISGQFSADPTARVFNGKMYLYPSHDIPAPEGQRQDWFCMADYHVFSSQNLVDWTDHGMILSQTSVPWGKPDAYSMWAPDCVCKNGKYYFYYPNAPKSGRGFAIGVAIADRPEGPFKPEAEPIAGVSGIDPCVLIDDDGQAYIYWSGMGIRGAKLKANMTEVDGELTTMAPPPNAPAGATGMKVAGQAMEGLPEGFKEGPFAFKRGDWYYLTFPWVRGDTSGGKNPTETLAYSMSKSPLGPWDFKGIIMAEHENGCWTNHHSIVEYQGQWYLFYHHNDYSPRFDKNRSVCIDLLSFNADGTIKEVKPTLRGVGINDATHRLDIDRYSSVSAGTTIAYLDTLNAFRGWSVDLPQKGSWVRYNQVDFSMLKSNAYLIANVKANANTTFFVRENDAKGKILAKVNVTVITEGQFRRDNSGKWLMVTTPLLYVPKGVTDLCITCEDKAISIDWMQFKNREEYFTPVSSNAAPAHPDSAGFIRRWTLLDPIDKPNRSNTVFTDSYLRENFLQPYFKDQLTVLPKNGQKVKVGKQTLTWRSLDSNRFNIKLFRFGETYTGKLYGVLYWAVTIIDCPEEIKDVRLAVGSNGASMWWLNGEEALLLSSDRRMVEDDGMSQRLTLKKGRNILRGTVINGPGMSDFCVRFVDEKGNPVTNYTIIAQ